MARLQALLAELVRLPQWLGFALLGLAAAVTILGRHGQRLLNAAVLGTGFGALVWVGMRAELGHFSMVPGLAAIAVCAAWVAFGLLAPAWGTAFLLASIFGAVGGFIAHWLGFLAVGGAAPLAGIGLFAGYANHRRLPVWLSPLFCAPFLAAGGALLWLPRRARVHGLADVEWALGLTLGLFLPLLALSLERAHRAQRREEELARRSADEKLKQQLAAQQKAFRRSQGIEIDDPGLPH